MAPSPRFRPVLLTVASLALLIEYLLVGILGNLAWRGRPVSRELLLGLVVAAMAAPLLFVARLFARARLRASGKDALAPLRRWVAAWPRAARALLAVPTALALAVSYRDFFRMYYPSDGIFYTLTAWLAPAIGAGLVGRALLRGFLVPLVDPAEGGDAEGFTFSAVAVTPETRAAVGGILALTLGVVGVLGWVPPASLYRPAVVAGLLGYVAVATGAALLFQRVSRIGVGFDGVLVHGSSRTRFYAYRDVDEVEATRWGDVLLRRHGRVILRLQLHGSHEGRHAAVADRIREGLARAREQAGGGARRLAEARGPASFVHAALGQGSFRAPGVTREALWELVEAAATSGASRAAAAEALAIGADGEDRARLRFAAERCADPEARAALARSAAEDEAAAEEAAEGFRGGARRAKSA